MSNVAIWARRGAIDPHWQLGETAADAGRWTLFGWNRSPPAVDGGMEPTVADVWAHALSAVARVSFACSTLNLPVAEQWVPVGQDMARGFTRGNWWGRAWAKAGVAPASMAMVCTRRAERVRHLFDDAGFPWWLQSQVVLLSRPDAPPPEIDQATLLALLDVHWARRASALVPMGVQAVMRPGVDGDVMGLLVLADELDERLIAMLESQADRAEVGWSISG